MFLARAGSVSTLQDTRIPRQETFRFHPLPYDPQKVIERVDVFFQENQPIHDPRGAFEMGRLYGAMAFQCQQIEANTHGIWAFFQSIFNPNAYREQKALIDQMQNKCFLIEDIIRAIPSTEEVQRENHQDIPHPVAFESGQLQTVDSNKTENRDDSLSHPNSEGVAPPPPPPPAPPPPSLKGKSLLSSSTPSAVAIQPLTEEEKYFLLERQKRERNLKERANPDVFYLFLPPKNERDLCERKLELQDDLAQNGTEEWLQKKKKALEKVEEQLIPIKTLLQYGNQQQRPDFNTKIAKYTNDELRIVIGIFFDGKEPNETDLNFTFYLFYRELLDGIFKNWQQLSCGETAQAFLSHADAWKRNLTMNRFGFITTLQRRLLPPRNRDYLPEPFYEILPYRTRRDTKSNRQELAPPNVMKELDDKLKNRLKDE